MSSRPAFGKRNAPRPALTRVAAGDPGAVDQTAFFQSVRAETRESAASFAGTVPHSFKAASMAGLVVGCGLAGFNVTDTSASTRFLSLTGRLGLHPDMTNLTPAMILLGLLSGIRAAALTLVVLRWLLDRAGRTDHLSYMIGGAAIAACVAGVAWVGFGHEPAHGWAIECLAGAAAGLMYRVFAGIKPA